MLDLFIYAALFTPGIVGVLLLFVHKKSLPVWWISMGASLISLLLVSVLCIVFIKQGDVPSGLSSKSIFWSSLWEIELGFTLHFLNLSFLICIALVFFLSIILSRFYLEHDEARAAPLLILMSTSMAAVAAKNIFFFSFFCFSSILSTAALLGSDSFLKRTSVIKHYVIVTGIADLFTFLTALYFHPRFHADIQQWFAIRTLSYEVLPDTLCFFLLLFSCLIRLGIAPVYFYLKSFYEAKKIDLLIPVITVSGLGFYAIFNFIPSLFPHELKQYASILWSVGVLGSLLSSFSLLRAKSSRDGAMHLHLLLGSLILLGFSSLNRTAWSGAWLLAIFQIFISTLLLQLIAISERRISLFKMTELKSAPYYAITSIYAVIASFGFPISFGFYAIVLIFWGISQGFPRVFLLAFLIIPIFILSSIKMIFFSIRGNISAEVYSPSQTFQDLDKTELVAVLPLVILLLCFGIAPDLLLNFIVRAVDFTLSAYFGGA